MAEYIAWCLRKPVTAASKRLRRLAVQQDVEDDLRGSTEADFRAQASWLRSSWSEARKASCHLHIFVSCTLTESGSPAVTAHTHTNTPQEGDLHTL
ncbi:uncharacterized protein LOC142590128 isoform X2 [Dermacentor variabilis]|uniref:uncharacterized protein LOC142590128 isoform X2 n=1 Tax=Dermacentor variabilis TaxID=34621 RepID=UPI003F5BCB06